MENTQQNFSKWFRAEVATAFAIGSVVAGAIIYFMSPISTLNVDLAVLKTQVDNIKNNDLTHIELTANTQATQLQGMQNQLTIDTTKLDEILTILGKKQ